ncbi:MAG TPA: hypothetical protein VIQ51_16450 [Chryseosolibacter sp.]
MKTLIVYYSFTQNNEKLAKHLHKMLNCDIVKLETVRQRSGLSIILDLMFHRSPALKTVPYYLRDYDHVIFIAPIWAGRIAMPLKAFLAKEKSNIKRYSFVTVCGGTPGQKEKIKKELASVLNIMPENVIELWINNLLPADKKDTIKYTSGYRIESEEFLKFEKELQPVINVVLQEDA